MQPQKEHIACDHDYGNTDFCNLCLDTENCPVEKETAIDKRASMLEHAKRRVYEDFAKKRAEIERMPDGKNKARALILWHTLQGLCFNNNPLIGLRQLDYEDQTGVYHKP